MAQAAIRGFSSAVLSGSTVTLPLPAGAVHGDYLIAAIGGQYVGALVPPAGWTMEAEAHSSSVSAITVYSHIYDSTVDPTAWVWGGSPPQGVLAAIYNYNFAAPLDGTHGGWSDFVTTVQPGSLTPTYTDDLALAFGHQQWSGGGPFTLTGPGSPWTEDYNHVVGSGGVGTLLAMDHQQLSSAAAVNPTFTGNAGAYHLAALQLLIHSGAGAPPPVTFIADADASQVSLAAAYQGGAGIRHSADAALVVYGPAPTKQAEISQEAALVVYAGDAASFEVPETSQVAALVVWGVAPPGSEARTRSWAFTRDGHPFYVLDLGEEGTFLYDISTSQWCRFVTAGYEGWNMRVGTMWGDSNRIVGGDTFSPIAWELVPELSLDEGFRDIVHVATGGVMVRSRTYLSVEALRVAGSLGYLDSTGIVLFNMRFSDDNGATWSPYFTLQMTAGDFSGEVAWRSLGSFMAPGRVFELSDSGGLQRIDGADVFIEDFDDLNSKYMRQYGVYQ